MLVSINDENVSVVEIGNYKKNKISLVCIYDGSKKNYVILINDGTCYLSDNLFKAKKIFNKLKKGILP